MPGLNCNTYNVPKLSSKLLKLPSKILKSYCDPLYLVPILRVRIISFFFLTKSNLFNSIKRHLLPLQLQRGNIMHKSRTSKSPVQNYWWRAGSSKRRQDLICFKSSPQPPNPVSTASTMFPINIKKNTTTNPKTTKRMSVKLIYDNKGR